MNDKQHKRTVEVIDLDAIMRMENGRNVLLRILRMTGYFDQTFNVDQRLNAFNEGKRQIGLELIEEMRGANPAMLLTILKENLDA